MKRPSRIKLIWWAWAIVVAVLLWLIIIGGVAKIAGAYELDKADSRVPLPAIDWRFLQQQCEGYDEAEFGQIACAYAADESRVGEINEPKGMGPGTYWHETAHLFDFSVLTDAHRREFLRLVGRAGEDWWSDTPAENGSFSAYDPPGEWFADAYSICALRATGRAKLTGASEVPLEITRHGHRVIWPDVVIEGSSYGYRVRWPVHQRICMMIGNAAGMHYNWKTGAYAPPS